MNIQPRSFTQKLLTLLLAAVLIVPLVQSGQNSVSATATTGKEIDYFKAKYAALDDNHVFQTLTYHELDHLLALEGNYVILFGGAWDTDTQAVIGHINEVAKQYGITGIHNFDFRLDGESARTDISDSEQDLVVETITQRDGEQQTVVTEYPFSRRYVDLVNKYLTNLEEHIAGGEDGEIAQYTYSGNVSTVVNGETVNEAVTISDEAGRVKTPFLFVYNKDHKQNGVSSPIVASLETSDILNTQGEAAYQNAVKAVFDQLPKTRDNKAQHSVLTNQEYVPASYNRFSGAAIFDHNDPPTVIEPVTLDEFKHVLETEGTHAIIFGCAWCGNTQAIIKLLNQTANDYGVKRVYNWDTKFDGGIGALRDEQFAHPKPDNGNLYQTRLTGHPGADIYVDLINTYFANLKSENEQAETPNVISYTNDKGETISSSRLQAPYVLIYNKDNKDSAGNASPVLGHVELMYSWTNIQPDYENGTRYNNYVAGLESLFARLEATPSGLIATAPSVKGGNDGQITGTSEVQEYRLKGDTAFKPASPDAITGLSAGVYEVRYASKPGLNGPTNNIQWRPYPAGQTVEIVIPEEADETLPGKDAPAAPTGLAGAAPTSLANNDGKITGASRALEYRRSGTTAYKQVYGATIERLPAGSYQIRYAETDTSAPSEWTEVAVPQFNVEFVDVGQEDWYYDAVTYLANKQITSGVSSDSFAPNAAITRGQFIVLLLNAYGIAPERAGADNFDDAGDTYYTGHLAAAKRLQITTGIGDNNFAPERGLSRQELFTLLYRALGVLDQLPVEGTTAALSNFSDADQIADYAQEAFAAFVASGIVSGSGNKLNPADASTRAQVAQVLFNLLSKE